LLLTNEQISQPATRPESDDMIPSQSLDRRSRPNRGGNSKDSSIRCDPCFEDDIICIRARLIENQTIEYFGRKVEACMSCVERYIMTVRDPTVHTFDPSRCKMGNVAVHRKRLNDERYRHHKAKLDRGESSEDEEAPPYTSGSHTPVYRKFKVDRRGATSQY
jgi:hypothetical protein